MTVLTTPVRPGRDAGQEPGPVPWPGMLWVTWRQHRVPLISVLTVYVVAAVFMLITGPKIHHDYATLTACHPAASLNCQELSAFFNSTDWHQGTGATAALLAIPVLPAMAASLGSYAGLAALTWFYLRDHYPVATFWPTQLFEAGWLLILS
ncbi:MAG TPA: hypothetical protein VGG83_30190, partial [Trebonia sp.]